MNYRAIVSITFDESDLIELAEQLGVDPDRMDAMETLNASLDDLELGVGWVEQFFADGCEKMTRLSDGITIEINPHEA